MIGAFDPDILAGSWFDPELPTGGLFDREMVSAAAAASNPTIKVIQQGAVGRKATW